MFDSIKNEKSLWEELRDMKVYARELHSKSVRFEQLCRHAGRIVEGDSFETGIWRVMPDDGVLPARPSTSAPRGPAPPQQPHPAARADSWGWDASEPGDTGEHK